MSPSYSAAARGVRGQSVVIWNTSTSRPRDIQKATKHIPSITYIKDSIETRKPSLRDRDAKIRLLERELIWSYCWFSSHIPKCRRRRSHPRLESTFIFFQVQPDPTRGSRLQGSRRIILLFVLYMKTLPVTGIKVSDPIKVTANVSATGKTSADGYIFWRHALGERDAKEPPENRG